MEFRTKKELLEYLGKNVNDNKLVDRMISRNEVYRKDWVYIIVDKDLIISELNNNIQSLEWEIERLKKEKADLFMKYMEKGEEKKSEYNPSSKWIPAEHKDHLFYIYDRLMMREEVINNIIQSFYNKNSGNFDWDWARDEIYKRFGYIEDPDEKDELNFISWMRE